MIPSPTIVLRDHCGEPFGRIRLAPKTPDANKGDCIFDITAEGAQADFTEVRWLAKRGFRFCGDHRFVLDDEGRLTVSQASFHMVLEPHDEEGLRTKPPKPLVWASWEE